MKVGRTSQDPKEVAVNIEIALCHALGFVTYHDDIKYSKVQSVSIKVGESPELPVFNQLTKTEILSYMDQQWDNIYLRGDPSLNLLIKLN